MSFSRSDFTKSDNTLSASKEGVSISCVGNLPSGKSYFTFTESNTLTINSTVGNISAIDFTCASSDYTGNLTDVTNVNSDSWSINVNNPGNKTTVQVTSIVVTLASSNPTITLTPATTVNLGTVTIGESNTATFVVKGSNLKGDITLSGVSAPMSLDVLTVTKTEAESTNGKTITVTYAPTTKASINQTVTASSTDATNKTLTITGQGQQKFAVHYFVGGLEVTTLKEMVIEGQTVTSLPEENDVTSCDETNYPYFIGWSTSNFGSQTTAPTTLVDGTEEINAETNYYAVFAAGTGGSSSKNYTLTLTYSDIPAQYDGAWSAKNATEVGGSSTFSVSLDGTKIMQSNSSTIQFRKSNGEIHNTNDLGNITSISTGNNELLYYIGTSVSPSSGTSGGYFKIYNSNSSNAKYSSQITINFTKTVGGGVTYTKYITTCCNPLGTINGSVSEDQPTSATLTWDVKDNVTWTVSYKVKNAAGEASTANVGTITTSEGKNHCTITGLNPATTYEFYVHATATGYCENEETWTIEGTTAAAHTITAVSSNSTYGTVSLSGNVITGEPADYCQYASPAFTVTSGTADVTQEGNVFTVDPSSDCTVQINFEKIPVYSVNLNAGTGSVASSSLPEEYRTLGVTLPVATAPTGWSFVGWTTASVTETATRPATIYSASSTYIPSADGETLYAVYEQWDGNENEFQRVTALNGLAAGDRVVVVSNGTYEYTLATDNGSFKKNATAYTADANNKISVSDNKHIWTLGSTNTTNVYTLTNVATGTTLGASALCGSGNNEKQKDVSLTSTNNQWLLTKSGTDFVIKNNAGASYLETASGGFCIYYQYNPPSGNPLSDYYQMLIFEGTAEKKYATAPKSVKALAVKTAPTTAYRVGDVFDATGTVLDATYSDDTHGDITEGYTYVVNNLSDGKLTAESNQVTYTYKGQTANLAITAGTLSSIVITTEPAKKKYAEGESFDATGMVVKAVFSNGLEIADVSGYTFSDAALTPSDESVTISYTYGEDTKTTTQAISVGSLSSIAVTTAPSTTSYTEGTAFSTAGMVVTGTYSNGETRVLNGYTIEPSGELSYPCTSVTISYQGKTTTQTITVSEAPKYTVHFWTNGTDNVRQVIQGRALTDIPTPAAVDGFTFMGWASAELEETTNEPASYALSKNASSYTPSQDGVAFYAVYRRSEESVKNGFKLSVTYSNTTYYVGTYGSYFNAVTDAANAEVYYFDEPNYIYGYDAYGKKYIKVHSDDTGIGFVANKTNASNFTISESDGLFTFTDGRKFAFNKNQKDRFASYDVSGDDSKFTKTAAQKVVSEYLYSTSAVVPVLQSIAVTTAPTKTEYFEGDDFEADGMVVTGTFDTGAKVLTASQYTVTPSTNLTAGTTSVTIAAVEDNTKTASQSITVTAIELTSITVTAPTKTVYVVGQNFDPTGMVVTAHYNDSRKDKAVTGYTMTPSTSTALTAEDDHIEISYTEGGVTKTANQAITVNAALTGIEITTNPDKMTYIETETFDATGMVVTAHYNGSDDQIVTASVTWDKTGVLAALNSLEDPTVETITFTYEESGAEVTTTLNVTVNPYPRYTVTFSANGTPTNVTETAGQGGVTVPEDPTNIGDYTFAGWSKSQRAVESADDPALVTITAGKYYPAGAETLYAVYTMDKEDEVAGMLLSIDNGEEDDIYVGSFNDKQFTDAANAESALPLWFKDGLLFYMNGTTPTYVSNSTSGKADLTASTSKPNSAQWVRSEANGKVMFQSTTNNTRYLAYNTSQTYFRAYGDSYAHEFTVTTSSAVATFEIPFYTTAPSADVTPTISFAETSKTIAVVDENGALNTCTNALTTNSTGAVTYVSSDESIAEVAANGTVSVKKVGEVTITANVAAVAGTWKAISKSYTLTIEKATASASFGTPATTIVYKDNTIALPATSEQAITITYSCSNPEYATVDASGNVTGIATTFGTNNQRQVTIYAEWAATDYYYASTNSTRGSQKVNIKNNAKTQTLSFTDEAKDFANNQGDKVYTNTLSGAKTTVTYSSSDDNVAEVDENTGEVTVHTNNVGTATITASAAAENVIEDGITFAYGSASKYYTITINYPEPTISVVSCEIKAPISVELSHDNAAMLMYTLDGSTPSYASNNGEIYDDPIVINDTKTLKAIAVSANEDESLVAEAVYTKITPTVTCNVEDGGSVPAGNGAVSLTAADDVLITYELRNGANTVLASGSDVHSPISLDVTMGSGYKLTILSQWDCENGFSSDVEEITFKATGAGLLPINYNDNKDNLPVYFTPTGLGNYSGNGLNTKIKFSNSGHKLVVQFANEPAKLSYTLKLNGDGTDYVFTVEESANGTTYTTLKEHNSSNNALSSEETTFSNIELASTTRYIRWTYTTKPSGTNIGLGNISITASSTGTITIDGVNVTEVPNDFHGNVTVVNGGTFDVSEDKTLENLTVEAGGKVSIAENKTLTVNTFTIESTMASGKSGQLNGATAVNFEASEAYIDITLGAGGTNQQWHAFTVPFPVDVTSGIYDLDGAPLTNEVNYAIMEYFGDERAKGNYGWKKIRTTLVPGTFYIMATDGYRTTYRFKKKAGEPLVAANSKDLAKNAVSGDGEDGKDNGWNGVGNPTLMYGKVGYNVYVLNPNPLVYDYELKIANSTNFVVGTPFFIQAADAGTMSMVEANASANYAPARVQATEIMNVDVTFGNEVYTDHLYISASEDALNEYQTGKDLVKMTMSNTPRVGRIFSNAYGHQLTMVYAPLSNDQAIYDLSLYAPQAGTYSIAVPNDVDATIYLTYEGSIIWDLTASAYEIDLTKGTTEGYGLILRTNAPAVVTGVDQIDAKAGVQKVIIDEHVYILRGGQMYDVNGKMVK